MFPSRTLIATLFLFLIAVVTIAAQPALQLAPNPGEGEPAWGILPGEEVPLRVLVKAGPLAENIEWGVSKVAAPAAWKVTRGKGVKVAVLDTGCDMTHPDLEAGIIAARDFTASRSGVSDLHGHGCHCIGIIGARANNDGIIGVAPDCGIIVVKVLSDSGRGSDFGIASGIDWSVAQGADVISMSLGSSTPSAAIHGAVQRAVAAGVIVICAAGNEGPGENTVGYPGGFVESIAVAASDSTDTVARFSSRGPQVFTTAPGVNIRSTYPGGRYSEMSGTSMACPHVAGAAALWCAANPTVAKTDRPAAFRQALQAACKDLGPVGRDTAYGYGLVSAEKLVAGKEPPVPPPAGLVLTEADLTPEARLRLESSYPGGKFRLELPGLSGTKKSP